MDEKRLVVLLIEDNPADARLIGELLTEAEGAAFDLECADHLSTALERLAKGGVDVALLDLGLPDSRGLETAATLSAQAPALPVVVLTGLDDEATGVEAVRRGAQDYLVKGQVDSKLLSRAIRYAIERKWAREELRFYAERLKTLHEIDEAILSARSLNAVAEAALERLRMVLPCSRASIAAISPEANEATILAVKTDAETKLDAGTRVPLESFGLPAPVRTGEVRVVEDISALPEPTQADRRLLQEGIRSYMNVPLMAEGELVGFLNVGSAGKRVFSPEHHEIALEIADMVAVAIHEAFSNAQMLEHSEHLARRLAERTREMECMVTALSDHLDPAVRRLRNELQALADRHADGLHADGRQLLHTARRSAQETTRLMDGLLAFGRAGTAKMDFSRLDMAELSRRTFEELEGNVPGRRAEFHMGDLPAATGDEALVREVLADLLSNAIKFTRPNPGARIEVGGTVGRNENTYFVKDNGVGFDLEDPGSLFYLFHKAGAAEELEGIGAGLAVVKRIVERHGGRVWAEGKANEGATFHFTLPVGRPSGDRE